MISLILELLPVIGPIKSILGLATEVVAEPSAAGAMGGLASTIAVFNWFRPHINKMVDWTDTPYDNNAWNFVTTVMGWVVKFARLDAANVEVPKKKRKKK